MVVLEKRIFLFHEMCSPAVPFSIFSGGGVFLLH